MQATRQGLWAVHFAVFLFGLTALFPKTIGLDPAAINLLRSVFAVLGLYAVIRWQGDRIRLCTTRDYAVVTLLGVLLGCHWVTYFHAIQMASVAVAVIALFTFPVMTVFIEPLFHAERPRWPDVVSAVAVLFGIYLLVPEFSLNDATTQGVLWGMLSALLFSLRNIIQGRFFSAYSARQALFYQTLVTVLVLLPFAGNVVPQVNAVQWGELLLLGIVFTALPHTLFAFGLRHLKAKTASLVACLQVVYATAFAAMILGEQPDVLTAVGGIIVVSAAIFETYSTSQRRSR